MNKKILGLALTAALTTGTAQAAFTGIDDFNGDVFAPADAPLAGAAAGNSSAGHARSVSAASSGLSTSVEINTVANAGVYAHSQDSGITGTSQVDFALGGLDLTMGANAFGIELASADLNGVFGVIVDGVSASMTTTTALLASALAFPSFAEILFSDFAGVDFTSVNMVSLFIDGSNQAALDMSIDNFGTTCSALSASGGAGGSGFTSGTCTMPPVVNVPEPTSLALLGAGLVAFGFGRRKAK